MITAWPLVGRDDELQRVSDALADPSTGGIVLIGDAGVGKTRFAQECIAIGDKAGFASVATTGSRSSASIPFGALAPLLPPISSFAGDRPEVLRQAFDAVASMGGDRPLLLFVDDAHLLDEASAAVVHQVALANAAFVVATVRAGEPVPDPVTALWKDGLAHRFDLEGLPAAEHHRLLETLLAGHVDEMTAKRLFDASRGNPLITRELVLAAKDEGTLVLDTAAWRLKGHIALSQRLTELVEARLGTLDELEARAIELVALSEPIGFGVLEELGVGPQVESLDRRGLVHVALDGHRVNVSSAHPIYAEVARRRLPALRARNHRRALATSVEGRGARRREDVLRVATWRLDAGLVAAPELTFEAARQARAAYDHALAERLAQAASDGGAAGAEMLLAEIAVEAGRPHEADRYFALAVEQAPDEMGRTLAIRGRADNMFWGLERPQEALEMAQVAADEATEQLWRDVLSLFVSGHRQIVSGQPGDTVAEVTPLIEHDVPLLALAAGITASGALILIGRYDEAVALAQRMYDFQLTFDDVPTLFPSLQHRAHEALAHGQAGRLTESERVAASAKRVTIERGIDRMRAFLDMVLAQVRITQGRLPEAIELANEALPILHTARQAPFARLNLAALGQACGMSGDASGAREALDAIEALGPAAGEMNTGEVARVRAWMEAASGHTAAAALALREGAQACVRLGERSGEVLCLHDLARLGDRSDAAEAARRLAELAPVIDGPLIGPRGDHARALAGGDAPALMDVSERFESYGALLLSAEAAAVAAREFGAGGRVRESTAARRRAMMLAARCPGADTPPLRDLERNDDAGFALRERERQIARLAAQGLSDKEIAEREVLSVRTVGNHLARVYAKLGITGRIELAAALEELSEME